MTPYILQQREFIQRLAKVNVAQKQTLVKRNKPLSHPLHIVYLLSNTSVCGGVKIILEHAHYLTKQGIKVTLLSHYIRPDWFPFEANYQTIPFDHDLVESIPPCDIIVATYWDHIQAAIDTHIAPVVYFEQGDEQLFDRPSDNPVVNNFADVQLSLPQFVMTVSHQAADAIDEFYHRKSHVIPNAINTSIFNTDTKPYQHTRPYLLMMGSDYIKFKGTDDILAAYRLIQADIPDIDLFWITPYALSSNYPEVTKVFINPSQELIGSLYRGALAFISASYYESFSLPVLEAMSCGCPVVTTNTKGVTEYAKDYINCLFTPIGNCQQLAENMKKIVHDATLREYIIAGGLATSKNYSWRATTKQLIEYYNEVAQYQDVQSPE